MEFTDPVWGIITFSLLVCSTGGYGGVGFHGRFDPSGEPSLWSSQLQEHGTELARKGTYVHGRCFCHFQKACMCARKHVVSLTIVAFTERRNCFAPPRGSLNSPRVAFRLRTARVIIVIVVVIGLVKIPCQNSILLKPAHCWCGG